MANKNIQKLLDSREFVYKIDNKYYVLGKNICEECDDELIELFVEYEKLIQDELFSESAIKMASSYRRLVGEKFQQIIAMCYKNYHNKLFTEEKRDKYEKLISENIEIISKQIEKWLKAEECWQRSNNIAFAEATDFENNTIRIEKIDTPVAQGEYVIEQGIKRWKRSALVKDQSLHSAEFQCEISSEHKTFISASTGKQYMEGHHLIAMQKQGLFQVGLDVYANIVCLCPICHRRLHYATEDQKRPSLYQLYELRRDRLANSGIILSKEEFISLAI